LIEISGESDDKDQHPCHHLALVLIGKDKRLFDHLRAGDIELDRIELVASAGITSLRLRVIK
jgi:hypothetical protein